MAYFEFTLGEFLFPRDLSNSKANFRFIVDLRFINHNGQFTTEHVVMPSLDTFWECNRKRKNKPNYVRHCEENGDCGQFNMERIDDWDRLILLVKAKDRDSIHSIQFKVIDVDRKDAWDKVKGFLGGIVRVVVGSLTGGTLSESLGAAAADVQSFLLKKLAGGDNVLFRGSHKFKGGDSRGENDSNRLCISGNGTEGKYKIRFSLNEMTLQ